MEYGKGTIVLVEHQVFKDDGSRDPKFCHPAVIVLATDLYSGETYYLTMTSQIGKYVTYEEQYFLIEGDMAERSHLKKPSMVNLANIYRAKINERISGGLEPRDYKAMIAKFKAYQAKRPDPYYQEIKGKIH